MNTRSLAALFAAVSHYKRGSHLRRIRGLIRLLRPYRPRAALMFISLIAATGASLAPAPLAKLAIDKGITPGDLTTLTIVVLAFVGAGILLWIATASQTYLVGWIGQRVLQDLRLELFSHLQRLSIDFYSRNHTGVVISRLSNDIEALDQLVTDGIVTLVGSSLLLIGTLIVLLALDTHLVLLILGIFPILGLASLAFRVASSGVYRATRERIAAVTAYLQETLSGVRVVRMFAQEPRHRDRMTELNAANQRTNMQTVYLNAAYFPSVELLSALATAIILLYGGYQVIQGRITVGVLVAFIAALNNFFDPIQSLSQLYTTYQAGMAALDKIFELLEVEPDIAEEAGTTVLSSIRGAITLEDVSFHYAGAAPDTFALTDISLRVEAGETVAVVGQTGAGKSTLAKLIARFYDPSDGRVLLDDVDLRSISPRSLREQLGIVAQEPLLFTGTIRENIAFARPDANAEAVETAARAAGAHDFICRLADGYDTDVGERGAHLSAGQRQLVAFARALITDPPVLLLDEATSMVDFETERKIEIQLDRILKGRTTIIIAHRLSTTRRADRIVVMELGRITEIGTHDQLLARNGTYAQLFRDWAGEIAT